MADAARYLGLDIATRTGFALWTERGADSPPLIRCGSWDCGKANDPAEALSDHLTGLLRACRQEGSPIIGAAIESPIRKVPTKKVQTAHGQWQEVLAGNPNTMFVLNSMYGAARAILRQFKVPADDVASSSWRKLVIGVGRTPRGEPSDWFKKQMRHRAGDMALRFGFEVPNHDASDALGIAIWRVAQSGRLPVGVLTGRGKNGNLFAAEGARS